MNPVILHIPHASTHIPEDERDLYSVSAERLGRENLLLADLHTDTLYDFEGAARAVFPLSRFTVDVERFCDDAREPMAKKGMGALYTNGVDLTPIRPHIPSDRRERLMNRYYWPHHNRLDDMAAERLDAFGVCLLFDCHSYPSRKLPYEEKGLYRPQIGIGTDSFHTPPELAERMEAGFAAKGYEVGLDTPFSGSLVPNRYYGKDRRVLSVMIEVRRDLYMDEETGEKSSGFERVQADIVAILKDVAGHVLNGHTAG